MAKKKPKKTAAKKPKTTREQARRDAEPNPFELRDAKPTKKKPVDKTADKYDWRTPPNVADCVRAYGGGRIALDPCTGEDNHLGAAYFHTIATDGLMQDWSPTLEQRAKCDELGIPWVVFINPPYGKFIHAWLKKISEQADRGVPMIVLLSATRYEQQYFTDTLNRAGCVCYIRGRVPFIDPKDLKAKNQNRFANKLWGFNLDIARFSSAFRGIGPCYVHLPIPTEGIDPLEPVPYHCPHARWTTHADGPATCAVCGAEEDTSPLPEVEPCDSAWHKEAHSVGSVCPTCSSGYWAFDPLQPEPQPAQADGEQDQSADADPYCDGDDREDEPSYTEQVIKGAVTSSGPLLCGVCEAPLKDGACPEGHDHANATRRRLPTVVVRSSPPGIPDLDLWAMEAKERLDGRPVVVSVSGGKDSTAVCLLLKEAEIPYTCIHMDTGWEHDLTVDYVRNYLPSVIGDIKILQSHLGGMPDLVRKRGMFPSRVRRFCTQELKVRPFKRFIRDLQKAGEDPVNAIGIRRAESKARSELEVWEEHKDFDCLVWRPIAYFTEADVIAMHHRHGVKPNPLYLKGASRVGCWPCIFARKKEIRMIADLDPARIDEMEALEQEVTAAAAARYAEKGETFESLGYQLPTWFPNPTSRTNKATGKRSGDPWPIRDVVGWARTKRGGKEDEPLAPGYAEEGCMRWGLCEMADPETERENAEKWGNLPTLEERRAEVLAEATAQPSSDPALDGFI